MKNPILIFILSLTLFLSSLGTLRASETTTLWSSEVALPGEHILLYLIKENASTDQFELVKRPVVKNGSMQILQYRTLTKHNDPMGEPLLLLPILIIPDAPGEVTIEDIPIKFVKSGKTASISVPPLKVYSTSAIKWFNNPMPYGVLWAMDKDEPYVDESINAQMKILLPDRVGLASLPFFTATGMKILPFQLSTQGMLSNIQQGIIGRNIVMARGEQWVCYDLSSTIIPFVEGESEATGSVNVAEQVNVFSVRRDEILLPTLDIKALPLPPGAPPHYDKLVGDYSVTSATDVKELAMYESVDVSIRVTGTGALESIECPKLADTAGWKTIPATKKLETDINGKVTAVIFNQLIRPTREEGGVPAFRLSYFNPATQRYEESLSKPIPLKWKKTDTSGGDPNGGAGSLSMSMAEPPPAGEVPVAQLSDIYSPLPDEISGQSLRVNPRYYFLLYAPAALIALYLLISWIGKRRASGNQMREMERALREIAKTESAMDFLRQSAAFIEKNLSQNMNDELRALIARRDREAFRPDAQTVMSDAEKKNILSMMRRAIQNVAKAAKSTSALIILTLGLLAGLNSAEAKSPTDLDREGVIQYERGEYSSAKDAFEKGIQALEKEGKNEGDTSTARLYYHLGNSYYRLAKPGQAALAYARALESNPSLHEAEANLAFIQRKEGAILDVGSVKSDIFTYLSIDSLLLITALSTAILLTAIMLLFIPSRLTLSLKWICGISALASLACAANWLYYYTLDTPHINMLKPEQIAYVVTATEARSAADEKGASVVRLPESTPLRVLARRPRWDYVECMNGVRGWVPTESIDLLAKNSH